MLTVFRKLAPWSSTLAAERPRKILFVKFAEQGSTVLAYSAIRQAVEIVGVENVFFVVFEDNRFILDVMEVIPRQNVFTISCRSLGGIFGSSLRAMREIRKRGIDAVVDMEFFTRASAAFTFLCGAPVRVGFHNFHGAGPGRGDLMTHRLLYNPHLHTAQTFRMMVEAVTKSPDECTGALLPYPAKPAPLEDSAPVFKASIAEVTDMRELIGSVLPEHKPLILLNPNASDLLPLRRWPANNYLALARRLLEQHPQAAVLFTGAPYEEEAVRALSAQVGSPRCASVAGRTTLRQLLVLFTLADVLVTNDSGPAHFASLTSIRTVTLFGPETPALYRALSPRNVPLWAGIVCSPCVNAYNNRQSPCRNNVCMQMLSVEQVFEAVVRGLD
jgi:ADP-heptose:LPS heptosyltransferase